jgi:hypothetical protein
MCPDREVIAAAAFILRRRGAACVGYRGSTATGAAVYGAETGRVGIEQGQLHPCDLVLANTPLEYNPDAGAC